MRSTAAAPSETTGAPAHGAAVSPERDPVDTAWLETEPLALKESVEQTTGLDGRPLLFDAETGKYVAISRAGTVVLGQLGEGTTARDVVRRLSAASSADPARVETSVIRFLTEVRQAGVLTLEPQEQNRRERVMKYSLRQKMPRMALTRSVHVLLGPVAKVVGAVPVAVSVTLWILLALGGVTVAGYTLATQGVSSITAWSALAAVLLVAQVAVHELAHALVCQMLRVPVREAGITLMLYVMPVAYVDRTDAYRVQGRAPRVLIALAGPMSDAIWAGVSALVHLNSDGAAHQVTGTLLQFQLLLMIVNLNPLLPSDGYHAIESAVGSVNIRGRSFAFLVHLLTRAPLPSHLLATSRGKRVGYCVFGAVCAVYGVLLVGLVLMWWWHMIEGGFFG
ncbi:metalloprotease [Streptomyces iconiensis]|uniref:PqqD family peptide modification chaperone n=1 Tax=Streptomyces iconiensis TaxID=1384038 RepID=A0ABT6ZUQ3_9ACTN|nr:PqqD family peptide modification chaperone [Streptomyces iconiensis]MDJ1132797.1 PqqD family peptide modification chaperone [Streptomyces iconiensis]